MLKSAGILLYRYTDNGMEFFLVHPGGPFWKNKDEGAWSIPKGEFDDEHPEVAARREFTEETGFEVNGPLLALSHVKTKGGKIIYAFAAEGNVQEKKLKSNLFSLEWPPRSGKMQQFPEVDKGAWFALSAALQKINPGQQPLITELFELLQKKQ